MRRFKMYYSDEIIEEVKKINFNRYPDNDSIEKREKSPSIMKRYSVYILPFFEDSQ